MKDFLRPPIYENFNKLSKEDQEYSQYLMDLGQRISFVTQDVQEGFGHAVFCAREWVDNEPFLLMLGDHLYASDNEVSCARQILDVYDRVEHSVVGVESYACRRDSQFWLCYRHMARVGYNSFNNRIFRKTRGRIRSAASSWWRDWTWITS